MTGKSPLPAPSRAGTLPPLPPTVPRSAGRTQAPFPNPRGTTPAPAAGGESAPRGGGRSLGHLLVEAGRVKSEELARLEAACAAEGTTLAHHVVSEGIVRETELLELVARSLRIQVYDPERFPPDPELAGQIGAALAGRLQVVPLLRQAGALVVAMPDPTDIPAIDVVQRQSGTEIVPVVCTETQFNELMSAIYGAEAGQGFISDEIEDVVYGIEQEAGGDGDGDVRQLLDLAEGQTAVRNVNWLISLAVREGASDLHLAPERHRVQLRLRVDGILKDLPPMPRNIHASLVCRLKILGRMDIAISRVPQDGRFTARVGGREINVRVSSLPTIYGEALVMRLLDMNALVFKLPHLGLVPSDVARIEEVIQHPHGMLLAAGPTGSGKSTTLYSMLSLINRPEVNIITVEDPVEYRVNRIRQIELNTKAGMTFAGSLRAILRQDPDVIMVGEIRDSETATVAVQAALTGHLVLSTIHTNDAIGTIVRFNDMGIEPFLVASVLRGVISQRLVRRLCPKCAEPWSPPPEALAYWDLAPAAEDNYRRPVGCIHCRQTGYRGRVGIYEILTLNETLQRLILQKASEDELRRAAAAGDFHTLKQDAARKLRLGWTSPAEAAAGVV